MKNFFIHLGFIFIIMGVSVICVDKVSANIKKYYADLDRSKEIINNVENNYEEFVNGAIHVKDGIVDVSKSFKIYFDDFSKKNDEIILKIQSVEKSINDLNEISFNLIDNCKYDLNNLSMNNKCKTFKTNYIRMINSYKEMLDEYNMVIGYYNDYAKKHKKSDCSLYDSGVDFSVYNALEE